MDNDQYEDLGGRRVLRAADGTFEKVELDSKTAAEMGRKSHKRSTDTSDALLIEAGYDPPSEAPEHLQVLAQYAASQKSGAVSALRDFRKITIGEEHAAPSKIKFQLGDLCPTCQLRYYPLSRLSQEDYIRLAEALEQYKSEREEAE